jgi:hypothetical protein
MVEESACLSVTSTNGTEYKRGVISTSSMFLSENIVKRRWRSFATRGTFVMRTAFCTVLVYLYADYLIQTSIRRNIDKNCEN